MPYTINEKINIRSRYGLKTKLDIAKLKAIYDTNNLDSIRSPKDSMPKDYDWTRPRDIFNMPVGDFQFTDKIWDYEVKKFRDENGEESWMIKEKGRLWANTVWLHTFDEKISERYYEPWTKKRLSCSAHIGGMSVISEEGFSLLVKLMILPRGSFKKYVTAELINDFYEMVA